MKRIFGILMIFTLTLSCTAQSEGGGVINMDVNVADFASLIDTSQNAVLLDVRTNQEFAAGRIQGAQQLNFYDSNFKEDLAKLDPNVPIFVYCRSGNRSGKAAKMMKELGFKAVYNLEGGIGQWAKSQPISK